MPKRSAFIYLPNGVNTLDYQITTDGADYQFSRSLKPLEKHRSVITRSVDSIIREVWGIITIAKRSG